jgi:hypothetical protein
MCASDAHAARAPIVLATRFKRALHGIALWQA